MGIVHVPTIVGAEVLTGAEVLDQVRDFIRRFVCMSEEESCVVALWVVHTHVFAVLDTTPYLEITSADKQSGKSRLLEVLKELVATPWKTGRTTAAALVRRIDAQSPTLLLDESDAAFNGEYGETLRSILNTGHRSDGVSSCCVRQGDSFEFVDFRTFCPKAIAGIGRLPETVSDRAFRVRLKRHAPDEPVERLRFRTLQGEAPVLRSSIQHWAACITDDLPNCSPTLPVELSDRQQDGAEPLLAIAELAGGNWASAARSSLIAICTQSQEADDSTAKTLFTDVRDTFSSKQTDRLSSADLVTALAQVETSPWAGWSRGTRLSVHQLAGLLKRYDIFPPASA